MGSLDSEMTITADDKALEFMDKAREFSWKDRLDKLLSREFLTGLLPFIAGTVAFFLQPVDIDFATWGTYSAIFLGIGGGLISGQKLAQTIKGE